MTAFGTTLTALLAAGAVVLGGGSQGEDSDRVALVIDASAARDGRELVDPRLEDVGAEVRLPRDEREARTNMRYFDALGYRIVVAGPRATAAAEATGVEAARTTGLSAALARL